MVNKGVRQGDPLSPFLFITAMEGLSIAMNTACQKGLFKGLTIPNNGPTISHLLYADDALFIGEWTQNNIQNLARILRCFHVTSGLKVNFHKSRVFGIGTSLLETSNWARPLGCDPSSLPFTYLGVPVGANMNLKKNWKPVIDRFLSKLSMWKAKSLSLGGRLTLLTSVLGNLPTFFLSLFVAPAGVIETLEKIRRAFLWGGAEGKSKINWVSWDKVIAAKSNGGMGVGSLKALSTALIIKWWWRLRTNPGLLWSRVITGIHNLHSKPPEYYANNRIIETGKT